MLMFLFLLLSFIFTTTTTLYKYRFFSLQHTIQNPRVCFCHKEKFIWTINRLIYFFQRCFGVLLWFSRFRFTKASFKLDHHVFHKLIGECCCIPLQFTERQQFRQPNQTSCRGQKQSTASTSQSRVNCQTRRQSAQ